MRKLLSLAFLALVSLTACSSDVRPRRAPRARIVVVVVLDQVGSWVLERALPHLDERGAIRTAIARGAYHPRVVYEYAGTYTAPGHAAIHSGAPPAESGVRSNRIWDPARRRKVSVVDDGQHGVIGHEGAFASPSVLRAETVADALVRASRGRSKIVSISFKDRGAVLPGGQRPTLALWYDPHTHGMTSSTYYGAALPPWLDAWQRANPVDARFTVWEPGDRAMLARVTGVDDAPGEGDWIGFGRTFPHDIRRTQDPYDAFPITPMSTEWLLDLATEATEQLRLGRDRHPDLLAISISGTDYVGHTFGPESWESLDNLVRVDRALGTFLARLETHGPVSLLITADHGVAPLPEVAQAGIANALRLLPDQVAARADAAIDEAIGPGDWVDAFAQPFLHLSAAGRSPAVHDRAVTAACAALRTMPGIALASDVRQVRAWRTSPDPLMRATAATVDDACPADVIVLPAPYSVIDEQVPEGAGTSHGSPWAYDTEVPVIFSGPGVRHVVGREPLSQRRVASTIAALLDIPAPEHARVAPLPGIRRTSR